MGSLAEALSEVPDHRSRLGQRHELSALLVFMCTGMLCGCRSLQALTGWGKRQEGALLRAMGFPRGRAPGYGTLQRLVSSLNVEAFEGALFGWAQEVLKAQSGGEDWDGLALDGKVLRGSRTEGLPGEHLLSVVAQELGITLAQADVPPSTNEAKACLPLLAGLNLTNSVVTGDAAFMQREVCQLIIKQQGHYLIVLKDNQPELHQTVHDWFEPFPPARRVSTAQRTGA
jgi:DDE family transposase